MHSATEQRPIAQTPVALEGAQAAPHAPQLEVSVDTAASQPLPGLPSQLAKPASQVKAQKPVMQLARALAPAGQTTPQRPQWETSVARFTSQPLVASPSQSAKPVMHATPHTPDAQVGDALARDGQAMPQAPQLFGSVRVDTSQPLVALPSQLAKPVVHSAPQVPAMHTAVEVLVPMHTRPHIPQCDGVMERSVSQPLLAMPSQSP